MGTPPACSYAEIYYAIHEYGLLENCKNQLHYYRRYIDDGFGIWLRDNDPTTDEHKWRLFQRSSKFQNLDWEFSQRATTANYLDLTVKIQGNQIVTSIYEKPMNLHLYLPSHSAHPPSVLRSLIQSMIWRIVTLTTRHDEQKQKVYLGSLKGLKQEVTTQTYSCRSSTKPTKGHVPHNLATDLNPIRIRIYFCTSGTTHLTHLRVQSNAYSRSAYSSLGAGKYKKHHFHSSARKPR